MIRELSLFRIAGFFALWSWVLPAMARDFATRLPLGERIEDISQYFLDARFHSDALGEGKGQYDSDPIYRLDAFDCTTFVETVWALHRSHSEKEWVQNLQVIRYRDGIKSFTERLHFISLDWMSYHLRKADIQDVSSLLGLPLRESKTLIDRRSWYEKKHPQMLKEFDDQYSQEKPQLITLPYVSFQDLLSNPKALDSLRFELSKGALLANFVRPNWDTRSTLGTALDISHQGFLMLKDDRIILRHASVTSLTVGDEDFMEYMQFYRNHSTLKGFQLIRLLDGAGK